MDNLIPPYSFLDYFADTSERNYSLGFMELLNMQDFGPSLSDVFLPPIPPLQESSIQAFEESLQVSNAPATPNSSSVSLESNDTRNYEIVKEEVDGEEEHQKIKKQRLKVKKTIEKKRQKEPRFAFMTKSEVDHLEDGFRWRKYGQKAVKNSHFPRSYYKCTTASCNVKKRVERSLHDTSIVITTYEGQHTHESPLIARSSLKAVVPSCSAFSSGSTAPYHPSPEMLLSAHHNPFCSNPYAFLTDHGLVQDIVPRSTV